VLLDPAISNAWFKLVLLNAGASVIAAADPCLMPKAAKNDVEIAGMKACHIRDGVAMCKFLCWLDAEEAAGNLHDEATLADRLEAFRKEDPTLMVLCFNTISAAGRNAALSHYKHENKPGSGKL
ncbi:X-Pro aminopeptidase, partial [Vibrio parahaemolyticus]